jgi:hypothetical protein
VRRAANHACRLSVRKNMRAKWRDARDRRRRSRGWRCEVISKKMSSGSARRPESLPSILTRLRLGGSAAVCSSLGASATSSGLGKLTVNISELKYNGTSWHAVRTCSL